MGAIYIFFAVAVVLCVQFEALRAILQVTVLWALVGYSLAFGPSISTGVIGDLSLSVVQFNDQIRVGTTVTEHAFFCFQLMFAIITPALISGAV